MPGAGIEPARLAAGDFESPASTNFTTRAYQADRFEENKAWQKGVIIRILEKFRIVPIMFEAPATFSVFKECCFCLFYQCFSSGKQVCSAGLVSCDCLGGNYLDISFY